MIIKIDQRTDALLVVDAQPTFMPGGGLAVAGGEEIMPVVMKLMPQFPRSRRFATKDRHPRGHISLASSYFDFPPMTELTLDMFNKKCIEQGGYSGGPVVKPSVALFDGRDVAAYLKKVGKQVLWPDHAIEGTTEAELHPLIREDEFAYVQVKGTDPRCDSYSGFRDHLLRLNGLASELRQYGVYRVICCGLAYDYCVGWTAKDAVALGFDAVVAMDATRSVSYPADSVTKMTDLLRSKGVLLVNSTDLRF